MAGNRPPDNRWRGRKLPQWSGPLVPSEDQSASWFPTDVEAAFAASVRFPRGTVLLVDTGSPGNLCGDEWTKGHSRELAKVGLPGPRHLQRDSPMVWAGVGTGSQSTDYDVQVAIGLPGSSCLDGDGHASASASSASAASSSPPWP